jgi:hypothetical protein
MSLAIKEMQIKMTLRLHLTPVRTATMKKTNAGEDGRRGWEGALIHCWWEFRLVQPLWKSVWKFLKKPKLEILYVFTIPPLGIDPKECKSVCSRDTCTPMFIEALFTVAKTWNQPTYPSAGEWIKKMW